jgi:heme exporter protein D
MIWQSATEFWVMGGYGVYVWGSLGVSAVLLALEVWLVRAGKQQALDAVCEAMDAESTEQSDADKISVPRVPAPAGAHSARTVAGASA